MAELAHAAAQIAAAIIRKLGESGAPTSNLNAYRTGGWGHDALYDLSLEPSLQGISHTASTATIEFIINRNEGDTDEYFGIANLVVQIPDTADTDADNLPDGWELSWPAITMLTQLTGLATGPGPGAGPAIIVKPREKPGHGQGGSISEGRAR